MDALKKKIIIAFLALLVLGVSSLCVLNVLDSDTDKIKPIPDRSFNFYAADFEKNIFEDEEYMSLNRDIAYTEGATTTYITDGDYEKYGELVSFFADYIDAVIRGDHKKYNTFFSKEYIDESGKKGEFTMQQLYDIELTYLDTEKIQIDETDCLLHKVSLEYKIRKNNGTYRNDMGSNSKRCRYYGVIERNGVLEIFSVGTVTFAQ